MCFPPLIFYLYYTIIVWQYQTYLGILTDFRQLFSIISHKKGGSPTKKPHFFAWQELQNLR